MKPVVAAITVGAITVGGAYAQGKAPSIDTAIGVGGIAIGLAFIDMMNPELAKAFGILAVVATLLYHGENIFNAVTGEDKGNAWEGLGR